MLGEEKVVRKEPEEPQQYLQGTPAEQPGNSQIGSPVGEKLRTESGINRK